jgi:hypothetical protein
VNWLNPNWLMSRLLERCGIATYQERVEFAAHFFAGATFSLMSAIWSVWIVVVWCVWTLVDEFLVDGFKGKDTYTDLFSKLVAPTIFFVVRFL